MNFKFVLLLSIVSLQTAHATDMLYPEQIQQMEKEKADHLKVLAIVTDENQKALKNKSKINDLGRENLKEVDLGKAIKEESKVKAK